MTDIHTFPAMNLAKHALLDTMEFSAFAESLWGTYYLSGLGASMFVGTNEDAVFEELRKNQKTRAILAHTHLLLNDETLPYVDGGTDPRKEIAYNLRLLPLGSLPSDGDINSLIRIKKLGQKYGVKDVTAAIFGPRGVWTVDIKDEKLARKAYSTESGQNSNIPEIKLSTDDVDETTDFGDSVLIRDCFPRYFMELEKPDVHDGVAHTVELTHTGKEKIVTENERKAHDQKVHEIIMQKIKQSAQNGVEVRFEDYRDHDIDPVSIMREVIDQWEAKFTRPHMRRKETPFKSINEKLDQEGWSA